MFEFIDEEFGKKYNLNQQIEYLKNHRGGNYFLKQRRDKFLSINTQNF